MAHIIIIIELKSGIPSGESTVKNWFELYTDNGELFDYSNYVDAMKDDTNFIVWFKKVGDVYTLLLDVVSVGTGTTGAAGTSAAVTNAGTSSAAKFNFTIPKGDKGDTGAAGSVGSVVSSGTGNAVTSISVNTSTGVLTYIKGATYAEKDTVTQFAIAVASWSSSTTTVDGTAYYTYTVTLTNVYKPIPSVCIGSSSVLPTADEQTAYNCIKYSTVDADTLTLKLYAESVPTSAFYVKVIGAA